MMRHFYMSLRAALIALLLAVFSLPAFSSPALPSTVDSPPSNAIWNKLLQKHVVLLRDGHASQMDYHGMRADEAKLTTYLASLSAVKQARFKSWSAHQQMAFLINAYNAWTVDLILSGKPSITSIKDLGSFWQSPWKKSFIPLLGQTLTLDDIETKLRDNYHDPRIHFAINCASIGCPALSNHAYQGSKLDAQLQQAAVNFLGDRQRNYLKEGTLHLSSIFKWYHDDFEKGWHGLHSLRQFLVYYRAALGLGDADVAKLSHGDIDIDYLDYDWHLNRTH